MVKLVDIWDTKYLHKCFSTDITFLFKCFEEVLRDPSFTPEYVSDSFLSALDDIRKEGKLILDWADARVTKDAYLALRSYEFHDKVVYIDTMHEARNAFFEENRRRKQLDYEVVPVPEIRSASELYDMVSQLRTDVVYGIDLSKAAIEVPLLIFTSMIRPEVQWDMGSMTDKIFQLIYREMPKTKEYDDLLVSFGGVIYELHVVDGMVDVPNEGPMDIDYFKRNYLCIPAIFGRECLNDDPEWDGLFMVLQQSVEDYFERNKVTLLKDVIG